MSAAFDDLELLLIHSDPVHIEPLVAGFRRSFDLLKTIGLRFALAAKTIAFSSSPVARDELRTWDWEHTLEAHADYLERPLQVPVKEAFKSLGVYVATT